MPEQASSAPKVKPLIAPVGPVASFFAGLAVFLVRALSARARAAAASFVGALAYALGIRRKVALENLRHAFPELPGPELSRIARGAYRNMALAALEALASTGLPDASRDSALTIENWPPVEAAIAAGKGVLVASAHFGSWELFAEVMARRGVKLNAVVRPLTGALNARIVEARQKAGVGLILQRGALRGMLAALGRGEVVAQLIDQALPSKSAIFVPFFGRPASTTPALSIAARRSGAPVFVMLAAREGSGVKVFAEGPIEFRDTGDLQRDLAEHTARVTLVIERYIRRYPEQWLWLHRRWKVQPPPAGEPALPTG
ncbi:MAG: lysophospholipid acyltransferase family protein [Myxococcaceae bacterium]